MMPLARATFIGSVAVCRAVVTERDGSGRLQDRQCRRRTVTAIDGVPLCSEHRKDASRLMVIDDTGTIVTMEPPCQPDD